MLSARSSKNRDSRTQRLLRSDELALLGMPFRLLIGLLCVGMIAPAVYGGWASVDYSQTERRIQSEVVRVLLAAQRYLQAGSGGETMDVSLAGGTFTDVEYVIFGDSPGGPYSRAVRYRLSSGQEEVMTARNPSVPLSSQSGGSLVLLEGIYSIRLECVDGQSVILTPVH